MELDSVQIGATDLDAAARAYEVLLGVPPVLTADGARRFQLQRAAVELEAGEAGVHSIRFLPEPDTDAARWPADSFHGLWVRFDAATESASRLVDSNAVAIDHVVIHSSDLDRAIALWRDRLGLRLALDRAFPARGLRMAFFRSAGVTLEFVSALLPADPCGPDQFYGLA